MARYKYDTGNQYSVYSKTQGAIEQAQKPYTELNAMDAEYYAKRGQIKPETSYAALAQESPAAQEPPAAKEPQNVQPAQTTPKTQQKVSYTKPDGTTAKGYTEAEEEPQVSYLDTMKEMYTKIFEEQTAANNEAAAAAAANALANIERQIESLNAGYQQTNKQLYRDRMEAERVLPQQMAAQGYTGGLSESGRLQLATSYGEALAQNERERLGQAAGLKATGAQAQYEAEAAAAEANAAARVQRDQSYLALEQQRQNDLAAQAETMAAVGDFSGYRALGYSQSEVDYLTKLWLAENPSYKSVWMAQHPEDAARLGVTAKKRSGSYAALAAEAESLSLLGQGYSPEEINAGIEQAVANGEYTQAQAQAERQAMGSYFDALNQMDAEYYSKRYVAPLVEPTQWEKALNKLSKYEPILGSQI